MAWPEGDGKELTEGSGGQIRLSIQRCIAGMALTLGCAKMARSATLNLGLAP